MLLHDSVHLSSLLYQDGLYGVYSEVASPKIRAWIDSTIAENGGATYCDIGFVGK